MKTIDKTEEQIRSAICSVPNQLSRSGIGDRAWTKAVFKSLADLGVTLKYQICSSSSDASLTVVGFTTSSGMKIMQTGNLSLFL
jgi:hypothetical protein